VANIIIFQRSNCAMQLCALCEAPWEVLSCSERWSESEGLLYMCMLLPHHIELFVFSSTAKTLVRLRVAMDDGTLVVGAALVTVPPSEPCQVAILTACGSVTLINLSPSLELSGKEVKIVSLKGLQSSPDTSTELLRGRDGCTPQSMSCVESQDVSPAAFLLLVGCDDGSIFEIYGGVSGNSGHSIIKRRNFRACTDHGILRLAALGSEALSGCNIVECALMPHGANSLPYIALCCARSNPRPSSSFAPILPHIDEEDDGSEGIWKVSDPSVFCDGVSSVSMASYFLHSETKQLILLCLPLVLGERQSGNSRENETPDLEMVLISSFLLSSKFPIIERALANARDNLCGCTLLPTTSTSTSTATSTFSRKTTDELLENRCWVATLCPSLAALFFFALPLVPGNEDCVTHLYPRIQIDLIPVLQQQGTMGLFGGQASFDNSEAVHWGAVLSTGSMLLGTNRNRLLVCSPDLTVAQNVLLQGSIVNSSIRDHRAIVTTSTIYLWEAPDEPQIYTSLAKTFDSLLEMTLQENVLDVIAAFEVAVLQLDERSACISGLHWVVREWEGKREGNCHDRLLELACRCLVRLAQGGSPTTTPPPHHHFHDQDIWYAGLTSLPGEQEARLVLNRMLKFAASKRPSSIPRLFEVCTDHCDVPSLAVLLYLCDQGEFVGTSALAQYHEHQQYNGTSAEALFQVADSHLELCDSYTEYERILLGLLSALGPHGIGAFCSTIESLVLSTWANRGKHGTKALSSLCDLLVKKRDHTGEILAARELCADFGGDTVMMLLQHNKLK